MYLELDKLGSAILAKDKDEAVRKSADANLVINE